jgi:anti-sigma B factor antagonist
VVLTLSSHLESETVTTAVSGDIDLSNADDLERHLEEQLAGEAVAVAVDLTEVLFIDSAGINILVTARRRADEIGKTLRVTGASGLVRELLDMTGVWQYLSDTAQ